MGIHVLLVLLAWRIPQHLHSRRSDEHAWSEALRVRVAQGAGGIGASTWMPSWLINGRPVHSATRSSTAAMISSWKRGMNMP